MTAPGDSVLLLALLAVFVACTGYAAGRLHQRYQTSQERQDAYQDGYESGSSSVFSTAVRMLGPRRPVRASAPVQPEPVADELGFPAPAPPPPYAVTEPGAVGGLTYRPFPDPRPADGTAPALGEAPTRPHGRPRLIDRSALALGETSSADAENISAEGRHTVPDELVQAKTYRLPPDRVFRARVRDGKRLPEEPTTPLSVPRPRQS
jgi:hypothetical protein